MSDEVGRWRPGPGRGRVDPGRFGPAAVVREGPESEGAEPLGWFAREGEAGPERVEHDRRESPRVAVASPGPHAWLGWWAGPGEFATIAVRLDNISQGGARLFVAGPGSDASLPSVGQIVWLCLGSPGPSECVQAKVLDVAPTSTLGAAVRLAFGTPCPENLYRLAVGGLATTGMGRTDRPPSGSDCV